VRPHRLGDLAHLDAMLDPIVADRLKTTAWTANPGRTRRGWTGGDPAPPPGHAPPQPA